MEIVLLYITAFGAFGFGYLSRAVLGHAVSERLEQDFAMRKQSNYRARPIRIPMGSMMRAEYRMQLHVAMGQLAYKPCAEAYNALAEVFNVVQIALQDDRQHAIEAAVITAGAQALVAMEETVAQCMPPFEGELAQVRTAVNQIDSLLGRMDVSRLFMATESLQKMKDAA